MVGNSQNNTPPPVTEEITSNHPLFLHQTDHPGLILISKKLIGSDNYSSWKRSIMIALNAKNKMKLVTGAFPKPSMESELRPIWERNNDIVISWILNTVSEPISNNLNFINSVSKLWDKLQEHYAQIDGKGVYYGNCGKKGHYQEECYKIVGYPVGHPLHGKYQPAKAARPTQDNRPSRTINMTVGHDNSRPQVPAVPQNPIPNNDGHVSARMDQLQNQINQVLLMLQNNQGNIGQGIFFSHSIKIPKFIATLKTDLKDAWIIDSGETDHKGYVLYDPKSHKTITSRHVLFDETKFPYANNSLKPSPTPPPNFINPHNLPTFPVSSPTTTNSSPQNTNPNTTLSSTSPTNNTSPTPSTDPTTPPFNSQHTDTSTTSATSSNHHNQTPTTPPIPPQPQRTSTRNKQPPTKLTDYQYTLLKSLIYNIHKHHYTQFINYHNIYLPTTRHLIHNINKDVEPHTYLQASKDPRWVEAMTKEIQALESNSTWELTTLPAGKSPIGNKWVFRIKFKADGDIERFKARLVAKGFNQKEGINYKETFAPVAKMVFVRALLAVATHKNWFIEQLDINNAFLHGDLHEEVYMTIPQGYSTKVPPNTVCRLKKSLYGLKQANRRNALLIYVDDILLTESDKSMIQSIKHQLDQQFSIKDLGSLHYYLGIEILQNSKGLVMSQRKYALDLLQCADVLNHKPSTIPLDLVKNLNLTYGELLPDPSLYRKLVGKLIYLTIPRLDLSFAAQALSQFSHQPTTAHMDALYRVLRYIKLSPGQGLHFPRDKNLCLSAYCDIDWATCPITRRSVCGSTIFLGQCLISWSSKKQLVVSRSSTEAEYRALVDCTCEIIWLQCLFKDLQVHTPTPTHIFCDNESTIALASNPVHHARTKHIEINCHFVRDKIKNNQVLPIFIPSRLQAADVLTKGLHKALHYNCLSKFDICVTQQSQGVGLLVVKMTTSSANNLVFKGFFEKLKLTGPNFIVWYRQLMIVLSIEDKLNYLEQPLPPAPVAPAGQQVAPEILAAHTAWIKGSKEIELLQTSRTIFTLAAGTKVKRQLLVVCSWNNEGLYRQSRAFGAPRDTWPCLGKTINELHTMLKLHEQTLPKNNAPALHDIRAGKVQKAELLKKKKSAASGAGGSGDLGEPANYKAALLDPESDKWLNAKNVEMQSMKDNKVWDLVNLPPNGKTVGSKWLFKKKTDMDRVVHTYKARLVAKGYTQTSGIDYEETFSPVANIRAIRILIDIVAFYDYEIWISTELDDLKSQMDMCSF
ncbi:retrovirus-related pol polyprotein from transposon TNT 1-94 [Tanacetum coccineum]